MAKLTDKQRKKIIAESVSGTSYTALAKKYGVSTTTIHRVVNGDPETKEKVKQKKEQNTVSVLAYMDSKKNDVCSLIDKMLVAMGDDGKLANAPVNQLATAMGILIDKYTANEALKSIDSRENNLFEAMEAWKEDDFSDLPEIQQTADGNAEMVENDRP